MWALHLPGPLPRGATRASAWTRVVLPCLCATCVPPAPLVGSCGSATWPCVLHRICAGFAHHFSSACHVSSTSPAEIKPLFLRFKIRNKINRNSIKIQIKIQKNLKCSEIHNFKIITLLNLKFSPLDHNSLSF